MFPLQGKLFQTARGKPVPWLVEWWNSKQTEDAGVRSTALVLFLMSGDEQVWSRSFQRPRDQRGEMKAAASGGGLRTEVQTFIDRNDV